MTYPLDTTVSSRPLPVSALLALLCCGVVGGVVGGVGCGEELTAVNQPARVTSVGPVIPHDWGVYVQYSLRDLEGDDQSVTVEICEAADADASDCPVPVQGAGGDGLDNVPTLPAGSDAPHRFSWNAGCGLLDQDSCVDSSLQTEYVARVRVDRPDDGVEASYTTSEPFTLDEIGLEELPECDPSAGTIPEPCQADDGSDSNP